MIRFYRRGVISELYVIHTDFIRKGKEEIILFIKLLIKLLIIKKTINIKVCYARSSIWGKKKKIFTNKEKHVYFFILFTRNKIINFFARFVEIYILFLSRFFSFDKVKIV